VCYCLGVTSVDPDRIDLLFERFVSKERDEPPDIDIDFEHERREEVIQYIYAKYGRDRAALTAEVISYRRRSAVRDVGKALGISLDIVDQMAKHIEWWDKVTVDGGQLRQIGLNPDDPMIRRLVELTGRSSASRVISPSTSGFRDHADALCELVPIENAAMQEAHVIEWDKDDVDAAGMLKIDVLGLGMLTCIRKCFDMVREQTGKQTHSRRFPLMLRRCTRRCAVPTRWAYSRLRAARRCPMLPRLKPKCFYDLVIEVAIVRPGPIQGDMVHPYLRRRNGEEKATYPNEAVRKVLGKTLGVPLFQEQCMSLVIAAAGLRGRGGSAAPRDGALEAQGDAIFKFGEKIISGMTERGYAREFAERCFEQIKGFSEYGFPESHAASFRAAGVRIRVVEGALPGGVRRGTEQQSADGVLRPGPDHPRREGARGEGARDRCQSQRLGLHAGGR
jgi:error-prone DNA polymerase